MKTGRPELLASWGISRDELQALYLKHGTQRALATHLGVSLRTVKNYFAKYGIKGDFKKPRMKNRQSALAKWVKAHPGVKLPASSKKISELTGIPLTSVKIILHRRKKRAAFALAKSPPLTDVKGLLTAVDGKRFPAKAIDAYEYSVDYWTLAVTVKGTLKAGPAFQLRFRWQELWTLLHDK